MKESMVFASWAVCNDRQISLQMDGNERDNTDL